jgi:hypothetical protein
VISSIEAFDYPFYGILGHPEIPYTTCEAYKAVRTPSNYQFAAEISNFLRTEGEKNDHCFNSFEDFENMLPTVRELFYSPNRSIHPGSGMNYACWDLTLCLEYY